MHMDAQVSGTPLFVAGNATITGDVTIGKQVGIWFGAVVRADKDRIVIGDRSNIQDNCVVHTSKGFPVTIGNDVSVGHGAILHGCTIGNQVLIGMGAIIINGAKVGDGSIIGAGAVITEGKDIPPNSVVIGVPGKVVKQADQAQQQNILHNAASYVELAREYATMGDVVVIGAGIAGIQAALDIADHGIHVHLIEREPTIGGHMAQLDKTFPTNDCSMCILSPKMVDVSRHPKITIHTCSEVEKIEGEVGHFLVTVKKYPRYIDESTCTGCGDCVLICPVEVYNRFDAGIGVRKAIYKPHPQAMPDLVVKDSEHCIECGLCYDVCGPDAIKRKDTEQVVTIDASSIVITTGYTVFDACNKTAVWPSAPSRCDYQS